MFNKDRHTRKSVRLNDSTLACGLVGLRFESQFGGCREVAQTYFIFFRSEILSCGIDQTTFPRERLDKYRKIRIAS
jgi:hypothetical protein